MIRTTRAVRQAKKPSRAPATLKVRDRGSFTSPAGLALRSVHFHSRPFGCGRGTAAALRLHEGRDGSVRSSCMASLSEPKLDIAWIRFPRSITGFRPEPEAESAPLRSHYQYDQSTG